MSATLPKADATPVRSRLGDTLFQVACAASALSVPLLLGGLLLVLTVQAWPFFGRVGTEALRQVAWDPGRQVYGVWALVYGTLATSLIALALAVPLGVGSAAFLSEMARGRARHVGSFLVGLLAAVPSVVYGFWGLLFLTPLVRLGFAAFGIEGSSGSGIVAAGLVLAIMVLPYVAAVSFEVCRLVPDSQRQAALALGATQWQMIRTAVLPAAAPGIAAACVLGLGRALGETMAVTLLIGNNARELSFHVAALGDSLASVIVNQLNEAGDPLHRSALVGLGLVLFLVTVAVNLAGQVLIARVAAGVRGPGAGGRGPGTGVSEPIHLTGSSRAAEERSPSARGETPPHTSYRIPHSLYPRVINRVMMAVLTTCLVLTLGPLFLILGYITVKGTAALDVNFFTRLPAPPGEPGGVAHALGGSALLVGLATLYALPVGILAAVYLAEFRAGRWGPVIRTAGELLAGVPSIVIGIFGYALLVGPTRTFSAWAGAFALGVMMVPVVMRTAEESLRLVPSALRDGSLALGATAWQTVAHVTVPSALPGIVTGAFLAVARIAGETAPLLLTAYGSNFWPRSPSDRTPFLPKYVFDYARSGYDDWERQAWGCALVLVAVVMVLNAGIRLVTGRRQVVGG
jgi:phosphate transport system permease protein